MKEDLAAVAKMHCFSSLPLAGNRKEGSVGLAGLSCRRGSVSVLLRCLSWQFLKMRLEDTGNICVGFRHSITLWGQLGGYANLRAIRHPYRCIAHNAFRVLLQLKGINRKKWGIVGGPRCRLSKVSFNSGMSLGSSQELIWYTFKETSLEEILVISRDHIWV